MQTQNFKIGFNRNIRATIRVAREIAAANPAFIEMQAVGSLAVCISRTIRPCLYSPATLTEHGNRFSARRNLEPAPGEWEICQHIAKSVSARVLARACQ